MTKNVQTTKTKKSNLHMKTISILSTAAIVASMNAFSAEAAGNKVGWYKYTTTTTTPTTTTPTTTTPTTTTPTTTTPTTTTPTTTTPTTTTTTTTPTTTTTTTALSGTIIDLSASYGLKSGQTLYYNSATNRHYTNSSFTASPQAVADIINKALADNKGKGVTLLIPAGQYILDKPLYLQDGVTLAGVAGQTKFIADDTFVRNSDNCLITNITGAKYTIKNIYMEYKGYKTPAFSDTTVNPSGVEGMMFKVKGSTQAVIDNCSFITKNLNGVQTKLTPIWVRDGSSNVEVKNCYLENTSGNRVGGCIWVSNSGNNISVHNNTMVKNGRDEIIAVWRDSGSSQDYNFYSNTINYVKGVDNASCDKILAFYVNPGVTFSNFRFSGNNINLTGNASRILMCDVGQGKFSNVVFENNNIKEYVGDSTGNLLLTVFEVWSTKLSTETSLSATYQRGDISFNNNTYTNTTTYGRRCMASGTNSMLKMNGNTVNSNFLYSVLYESSGTTKMVSSGNDYNYAGSGTSSFAKTNGTISCTNDKIHLGGTSKTLSNITYTSCLFE
ncbi:MAG: hypothetical protein AB9844_12185 [Clostridiaceae bacterium]